MQRVGDESEVREVVVKRGEFQRNPVILTQNEPRV